MDPEGMVHALELVHGLLHPGSYLIDIHPTANPPPIELIQGERRTLLGYMQETDDFIEYGQAEAALAQTVQMGLFILERQGSFTFITRAGSVAELATYLEENRSDAILPPEISQRARELENAYPLQFAGSIIKDGLETVMSCILTNRVHIARYAYKPLS